MKNGLLYLLSAFLLFLNVPAYGAGPDDEAIMKAVEASAKAEGKKLGDYGLVDQDGVKFSLNDYFKDGKPLVISFIYTYCPEVCPTITAEFKKAVDSARGRFGERFNVLVIGFDPAHDTPQKLKEYGARYTKDFSSFRFASSDQETIDRLTGEVGFYKSKRDDGSYDHMDMATVVKADGTIYKQVYSLRTQPYYIENRLMEIFTGKVPEGATVSLVDKLKFFCYKYDPYTGRYKVDYPVFMSFFIQAVVLTIIIYAVWGKRIKGFFKKSGGTTR